MGTEKKEKKKKTVIREILEWALTFVVALLIALPFRAFAFELVRVEGRSMDNTLADGEVMLVSKLDYTSVWLSFPWQDDQSKETAARVTVGGNPERFDVVICRYPGRGDTNFVKRVVGLPGDTVEIRSGYLYINDERIDEPYIQDEYRSGYLNSYGPYTVPDDHYFVLGDHRNNSNDSRSQGALSRNMIIGHVRTVLFPFNDLRGID